MKLPDKIWVAILPNERKTKQTAAYLEPFPLGIPYVPASEAERLREALEGLVEATSSAVNWADSAKEACGVAPWISQGDCNDVDLALLKAREALGGGDKK